MSDICLKLENLTFRRGDKTVLNDISWTVRRGENWAVLGPNGSGKTTLMMLATGYQPSSGGRLFLLDGYIGDIPLPELRKQISFVSSRLTDWILRRYPRATGSQVVMSGRRAVIGAFLKPTNDESNDTAHILRNLDAEHLADVTFEIMSTGERQRCLIGRSQMARSRLVILDEPCAGLDVAARETLLTAVESTCRRHSDVPHLLITHHTEEITPAFTHVLLLKDGQVLSQGPKHDVLTHENLTRAYGIDLRVTKHDDRVWVAPQKNGVGKQ